MDKLLGILKQVRPDVDFENETSLIENGLLESFDVVAIIAAISDEFDVELEISEIEPENFNSMKSIWDLIQNKKN